MIMDADKAIGVALLVYILAAIVPGAFSSFFDADTTGWSTGVVALWLLIPLFVVIFFIRHFSKGDGGAA
jgi:hypothetical protein